MIELISHTIVKTLFKNYPSEKIEIYEYGLSLLLTTLIGYISIIILSGLLFTIVEGLIFIFVFSLLRAFSGGFHCKTYIGCFVVSNGIFIFNSSIANIIYNSSLFIQAFLIIIATIIIIYVFIRFSPHIPSNHLLSKKQIQKNRKISIILSNGILIFSIIMIIVSLFQNSCKIPSELIFVIFTESTVALLIIISKITERRHMDV